MMKTIKKYLLVIHLLLAVSQLLAQQSNVVAGGDASGNGGSMAYSIGQTDFLYFESDNGNLSFGLQQTWFPGTALLLQNVTFPAGWSSLSSYLIPHLPALEDVFDPITGELIIAQTMTGYYYPGENTNTIGNWPQHAAFKIKTNAPCTLTLAGSEEPNKTVVFNAGWNLMPVISASALNVAELFGDVINQLIIAKDVAGTGIFWPEMEINTLGVLLPGRAYFVKVSENVTVEFPD